MPLDLLTLTEAELNSMTETEFLEFVEQDSGDVTPVARSQFEDSFTDLSWPALQLHHGETVWFTPDSQAPVPVTIQLAIVDRVGLSQEAHAYFEDDEEGITVSADTTDFAGWEIGKSYIQLHDGGRYYVKGRLNSLQGQTCLAFARKTRRNIGRPRGL